MSESEAVAAAPVSVVLSCNAGYAVYMMVAVASVVRHASPERRYEIVVLQTNVPDFYRRRLLSFLAAHNNFSLRWVDASPIRETVVERFSRRASSRKEAIGSYETYYRLFLASVLHDRPRALYIDTDTIVCDDLATLYDCDLQGRSVAGVIDVYLAFSDDCAEVREQLVHRGHEMGCYFNAGVLLIDLDAWRSGDAEKKMMDVFLAAENIMFHDQGLLNTVFQKDCLPLPGRWNFLTVRLADTHFPQAVREETRAIEAGNNWGIIHYAGEKPWEAPESVPLAHLWWEAAAYAGFDADLAHKMAADLRKRADWQRDASRLASLRIQRAVSRLKAACASGSGKKKHAGRAARLDERIREAEAYRKSKR